MEYAIEEYATAVEGDMEQYLENYSDEKPVEVTKEYAKNKTVYSDLKHNELKETKEYYEDMFERECSSEKVFYCLIDGGLI